MRSRHALPLLVTALALAVPAAAQADVSPARAASACPGATEHPDRGALRKARKATLCLVNLERRSAGLRPLRHNRRLTRAARRHSKAMNRHRFFDHVSPSGSTVLRRVRAAGYLRGASWYTVGENIGWGQSYLGTPLSMHRAWMESPGHRANLMRSGFREIGIGIVIGSPQPSGGSGAIYTQNFGARR